MEVLLTLLVYGIAAVVVAQLIYMKLLPWLLNDWLNPNAAEILRLKRESPHPQKMTPEQRTRIVEQLAALAPPDTKGRRLFKALLSCAFCQLLEAAVIVVCLSLVSPIVVHVAAVAGIAQAAARYVVLPQAGGPRVGKCGG